MRYLRNNIIKKILFIFSIFLCQSLYAQNYRWNLIEAFAVNDFAAIENILNRNIGSMSDAEKRLVMNFAMNYSYGENAVRSLDILERHNIRPGGYELYTAIERGQPDVLIRSILARGVEPNGEILLLAMEKQRFEIARQFIQGGVNVNYQYEGMTPLLHAARWGNLELARMLVDHGANINARDRNGNTALAIARNNGHIPVQDFLIERGAVESAYNDRPAQSAAATGIAGLLDSQPGVLQTSDLLTGTYQLSGGSVNIRLSAGTVSYYRNGEVRSGIYRIDGGNLTLTMEGQAFVYRIISSTSFSGNGEVWVRTGN
jgi:hypothetical protein